MKNFYWKTVLWVAMLFGIETVNTVILLSLHPLSYYYTAPGMWCSFGLIVVEMPFVWWLTWKYFKKVLNAE